MIPHRNGIVQILKLLVLLLQLCNTLLQVHLLLHNFRDIHAKAENDQTLFLRLCHSPLVKYPEQAAVFFRHAVCNRILLTHIKVISQLSHDPCLVLIVNDI